MFESMTKTAGSGSASGSGSICQGHESADPDPHQNVIDPKHWLADTIPLFPSFWSYGNLHLSIWFTRFELQGMSLL
jgi:hypothetical protein